MSSARIRAISSEALIPMIIGILDLLYSISKDVYKNRNQIATNIFRFGRPALWGSLFVVLLVENYARTIVRLPDPRVRYERPDRVTRADTRELAATCRDAIQYSEFLWRILPGKTAASIRSRVREWNALSPKEKEEREKLAYQRWLQHVLK